MLVAEVVDIQPRAQLVESDASRTEISFVFCTGRRDRQVQHGDRKDAAGLTLEGKPRQGVHVGVEVVEVGANVLEGPKKAVFDILTTRCQSCSVGGDPMRTS